MRRLLNFAPLGGRRGSNVAAANDFDILLDMHSNCCLSSFLSMILMISSFALSYFICAVRLMDERKWSDCSDDRVWFSRYRLRRSVEPRSEEANLLTTTRVVTAGIPHIHSKLTMGLGVRQTGPLPGYSGIPFGDRQPP